MTARFTISYTSDGLGNLKNFCEKYGLDKIVAEPDFTSPHGYIITGFLGEKFATVRINPDTDQPTHAMIDHVIKQLALTLKETKS